MKIIIWNDQFLNCRKITKQNIDLGWNKNANIAYSQINNQFVRQSFQ